jgi:prevent-host-death family protein
MLSTLVTMPRPISVSELKTHCLRIVEEVARGRREVVITKRGKRVARLVPVEDESPEDALDRLRGTLVRGFELADFETGVRWQSARR